MRDIFVWVGNGLILACALIGIASVVVHAQAPWRGSVMGRHLMVYFVITTAILCLSAIRIFIGSDAEWFAMLRLGVFLFLPIIMGQRLVIQVKAHRMDREEPPTPPTGTRLTVVGPK